MIRIITKYWYYFLIVFTTCALGPCIYWILFAYSFSHREIIGKDPKCKEHESNRISFHLKNRGYDLYRMIDSFKVITPIYRLPDSLVESFNNAGNGCQCCCINYLTEIYFDQPPKEVYRLDIERYRYHAGFEGEYFDDIGYLDIVSTYKNGMWSCSVTSKLDSSERRRVRQRLNDVIIAKLPMVKDTSAHSDEPRY